MPASMEEPNERVVDELSDVVSCHTDVVTPALSRVVSCTPIEAVGVSTDCGPLPGGAEDDVRQCSGRARKRRRVMWPVVGTQMMRPKRRVPDRSDVAVEEYSFLQCPWCKGSVEVLSRNLENAYHTVRNDHLSVCKVYAVSGEPPIQNRSEKARQRAAAAVAAAAEAAAAAAVEAARSAKALVPEQQKQPREKDQTKIKTAVQMGEVPLRSPLLRRHAVAPPLTAENAGGRYVFIPAKAFAASRKDIAGWVVKILSVGDDDDQKTRLQTKDADGKLFSMRVHTFRYIVEHSRTLT